MRRKLVGLFLISLIAVMLPLVVSANAEHDYLELSRDNMPADATEYTYFIVRGTSVKGVDLNNDYLVVASLEDLFGEIVDENIYSKIERLSRGSDAIVSADGQWAITIEVVTVVRGSEPVQNRASPLSTSIFISGARRQFNAVNGVVSIPPSIFYSRTLANGRMYAGNISRVDWEIVFNSQNVAIRGYGIYSGSIPFIAQILSDPPTSYK